MLTGEDGDSHKELRDIMRNGYSKESIKGRYDELVAITDAALTRDWSLARKCLLSKPCSTWSSISSALFSPALRRWNM